MPTNQLLHGNDIKPFFSTSMLLRLVHYGILRIQPNVVLCDGIASMSQLQSERDASRSTESDRFPPPGTLQPHQLWSATIRFDCLDERKCNPSLCYVSVSRWMRDVAGGCLDNGIGIQLNK